MNSMSTRRFRCTHKPVHPVSLGGSLGAGAALLGVLFGPAPVVGAAPSGPSSVDQVVRQLKAQGYAVVVNRFGTGRSEDCAVTRGSARPDVLAHRSRGPGWRPLHHGHR